MSTYLVDRGSAYPPTGSRLIARKLTELKSRAAQFSDDTAGSIMVLFGLMALGMFALMGVAIDMGRWLNARDQTVAATDAAVLAAGRALQTNGGDQNAALAVARTFYQQGVKDRLKVSSDTINFVVTDLGAAVKVTGNAEISTPFMGLIKIKSLPLMRNSGADYAKAVIASGRYENEDREVSLMLDVSGSMGGQKLLDLKKAAKDFIDIVVPANKSLGAKSKIALIPFSDDVRPPVSFLSSILDTIAPGPDSYSVSANSNGKGKKKTYYRTACVVERAGTEKYKNTLASVTAPLLRNYTSSGSCSTPKGAEVVPLNDNNATLKSSVDSLTIGGGTGGQIGTAWSYYMLSPKWTSLLPSTGIPAAFGGETKKFAVLMTDGEYNATHDSKGIDTDSSGAGSSVNGISSAEQAKQICTAMKADGIEVFTVGFDLGGNATAIATLQNCATDSSHFFNTATGEDLFTAFRSIALQVSPLRLAE